VQSSSNTGPCDTNSGGMNRGHFGPSSNRTRVHGRLLRCLIPAVADRLLGSLPGRTTAHRFYRGQTAAVLERGVPADGEVEAPRTEGERRWRNHAATKEAATAGRSGIG